MIIIGSGATAVTLLPALARTAGHVTMLQRSPTYIVSMPEQDAIANSLRRVLPAAWAYRLSRWKNMAYHDLRLPASAALAGFRKERPLIQKVRAELGPDVRRGHPLHPALQPLGTAALPGAGWRFLPRRSSPAAPAWSRARLNASRKKAVRLQSGEELDADIVVTATGLVLQAWAEWT